MSKWIRAGLSYLSNKFRRVSMRRPPVSRLSRHVHFSPSTILRDQRRMRKPKFSTKPFENFYNELCYDQQPLTPEDPKDGDSSDLQFTESESPLYFGVRESKIIRQSAKVMWQYMSEENKQQYRDQAELAKEEEAPKKRSNRRERASETAQRRKRELELPQIRAMASRPMSVSSGGQHDFI